MSRLLLFLAMLLLAMPVIQGQNWKRLIMQHQQAEQHMTNMQYGEAAGIYVKMLRELPESYNLKFMAGYSYLHTPGRTSEAIEYLEKASGNVSADSEPGSLRDEAAPVDCYLLLGVAYQRNYQFEEAAGAYRKYLELVPEDHYKYRLVQQYIRSIDNAKAFIAKPQSVEKRNLGRDINSDASNINAVLSGDGQTMAYTNVTGKGFDVYVVKMEKGRWGRPGNISRQLRRDYLLTSSLSYDGTELYLVYYLPDRSDIYHSVYEGGEWSRARRLGSPLNSRYNETHASISADGRTLYFTSNRPGGMGGLDIYRATLDERGRWRDVVNLGSEINTPFNEETPFLTTCGRYLFFSSEGHNSMGGYDVFYVDLEEPSKVNNPGYPVNCTGDNLFYFPVDNGRSGYISFWDSEGLGQKDIYFVSLTDEKEPFVAMDEVSEAERTDITGEVNGKVDLPVAPERIMPEYADEPPLFDRTYNVQYMALERALEAGTVNIHAGNGEYVLYGKDRFNRFVTPFFSTREEAGKILPLYIEKGYDDAFIRENTFAVNYTIQIAAMINFVGFDVFGAMPELFFARGPDRLFRYFWGFFETYEDAKLFLDEIRRMGFTDAFIRKL